jgi:hypothetical protein
MAAALSSVPAMALQQCNRLTLVEQTCHVPDGKPDPAAFAASAT